MAQENDPSPGGPLALFEALSVAIRLRDDTTADRIAVEHLLQSVRDRETEAHRLVHEALERILVAAGEAPADSPSSPSPTSPAATERTQQAIRAFRGDDDG